MNPNDLVYTNYDGIVDTLYKHATKTTEDILHNPDASYVDLEQAKAVAFLASEEARYITGRF